MSYNVEKVRGRGMQRKQTLLFSVTHLKTVCSRMCMKVDRCGRNLCFFFPAETWRADGEEHGRTGGGLRQCHVWPRAPQHHCVHAALPGPWGHTRWEPLRAVVIENTKYQRTRAVISTNHRFLRGNQFTAEQPSWHNLDLFVATVETSSAPPPRFLWSKFISGN